MGQPETEIVILSTARQQFSQLVNRVYRGETRALVEKSGIPVAALLSVDDLERLQRCDEERETQFRALTARQAAFADVPDDKLERVSESVGQGANGYARVAVAWV